MESVLVLSSRRAAFPETPHLVSERKRCLGRFLAVLAKGDLGKAQAQAAFQELSLELLVSKKDWFHFKARSKLLREGKKKPQQRREEKGRGGCIFNVHEVAVRPLMASLQLFSQLLNERKKCASSPSKPQLLALLGFSLSNALPKGPGVGGWLLGMAPGGPWGPGGCCWALGDSPSPTTQLWASITTVFLVQLILFSSLGVHGAGGASPSPPQHVITLM